MKRLALIILAIQLSGVVASADCESLLTRVARPIRNILSPVPEVPRDDSSDYKPQEFAALSLPEQHIHIWKRIQARHHRSANSVFFYDYEVGEVITQMNERLRQMSDLKVPAKGFDRQWILQHNDLLHVTRDLLAGYTSQRRIPYLELHDAALNFATLLRSTVQLPLRLERNDRFPEAKFAALEKRYSFAASRVGTEELNDAGFRLKKRRRVLNMAPRAILIPTFDVIGAKYQLETDAYPVFPAGLSSDPGILFDGSEFGSLQFLLHDYLHAELSIDSIGFTTAKIEQRITALAALRAEVAKIENPKVRKVVFSLYLYSQREAMLVSSKSIAKRLATDDSYDFQQFIERSLENPHDLGYFGSTDPSLEEIREGRAHLVRIATRHPEI